MQEKREITDIEDLNDAPLTSEAEKKKARKEKKRKRNRESLVISYVFFALFVALCINICKYVAVDSEEVSDNSFNARMAALEEDMVRGNIVADDGTVLAGTNVASDGSTERVYPYGSLFAHVVGYTGHGKSGLESLYNTKLLASHVSMIERETNELNHIKNTGDTVCTTLNIDLQEAASNGLGLSKGAVVCMDPDTGAILAMVSKPDYNPNDIDADYATLSADTDESALLNRVTQGLYPPGSTFKMFDLIEYLREGKNPSSYSYNCTGTFTYGDSKIKCYHGEKHGQVGFVKSFAKSCNGSFANMGTTFDTEQFANDLDKLLFNTELPIDFDSAVSTYDLPKTASADQITQTAIGQGGTLITPFHECLMACAIANEGKLMKPYLVSGIKAINGTRVSQTSPSTYKQLLSKDEAETVKECMAEVVNSGTGTKLKDNPWFTAYGKTGSAEFKEGSSVSHSWFVGFAEDENGKKMALAIIFEAKGSGSEYAVPLAKSLFATYFAD